MATPVIKIHSRRARRLWLREPVAVLASLQHDFDEGAIDAPGMSLLSWLAFTTGGDLVLAEHAARRAIDLDPASRFAAAALSEILRFRSDFDGAVEVLRKARAANPDIGWYDLSLADALIDAKRYDEATWVLEEAVESADLRRHALKRLARISLDKGEIETAIHWQSALIDLAPNYLVYANDYLTLANLYTDYGDSERAEAILRKAQGIYPRNEAISKALGETSPVAGPRPRFDEEAAGVKRIPVKTPLITSRSDLVSVVDAATASIRRPGDVIAVSESPAAASQGRVLPLELIRPSLIARVLCRYVGKIGPLHSPAGMQGAILDVGATRVLVGAIAGATGKLMGRKGWFYRIAGPSAAMIDDVAACLPPLDHHVIFGPSQPDSLASRLAGALGCEVAIVDANHLTGAWVVGASDGVNRSWVEEVLADNPAGNEDEQTPVVVIQSLT